MTRRCNTCGHTWPRKLDDGPPVAQDDIDALIATIKSSDAKAEVNAWLIQSRQAKSTWDARIHPDERRYQITSAALRLAECAARTDDADEFARMVIALCMDDVSEIQPTFVVGEALAALTIVEARRLRDVCIQLAQTDGAPSPADVAACLAAA